MVWPTHRQEPWKRPLPEFIEDLYERRFGRPRPERVVSLEERAKELVQRKTLRREQRARKRADERRREPEVAASAPQALSPGTHIAVRRVVSQQMNVSQEAAAIVASARGVLRHLFPEAEGEDGDQSGGHAEGETEAVCGVTARR